MTTIYTILLKKKIQMICDFFCKDNLQRIFILELTNLYLILYLPQVLKQSLDVIKCHQIISFVFQVLFFFRKILLFLSQMYAFIICHKAVVLNEPRESEGPLVVRLLCVCVGASTWGSVSWAASASLCLAFSHREHHLSGSHAGTLSWQSGHKVLLFFSVSPLLSLGIENFFNWC